MTLKQRIDLLSDLGDLIRASLSGDPAFDAVLQQAFYENRWFAIENTRSALEAIATTMLDKQLLTDWAAKYAIGTHNHPEKIIGIVMAGNIPLVGFHDWLCVFLSGQRALVKMSEKDKVLLPYLIKRMGDMEFESWEYTTFCMEGEPLRGFDAVIATGSNNSARYFEAYFEKYPHIIRHNRNGVAVLDGTETMAALYALGNDIFSYFGLGCRNVSKLYVPRGYDFEPMLEALHAYRELANHDKYKNNFDYNMTLFIMNAMPYMNNGCLLLREDPSLASRIASVNYEYYDDVNAVIEHLQQRSADIQCIVTKMELEGLHTLEFGQTQKPGLTDYPDGVDVMAWLAQMSSL